MHALLYQLVANSMETEQPVSLGGDPFILLLVCQDTSNQLQLFPLVMQAALDVLWLLQTALDAPQISVLMEQHVL